MKGFLTWKDTVTEIKLHSLQGKGEKEASERRDDNYSVVFQGCEYTQEEKIASGETKWQNDFLFLSNDMEEYKL